MKIEEFNNHQFLWPNERCYIPWENDESDYLKSKPHITLRNRPDITTDHDLYFTDEFMEWCCENLDSRWTVLMYQRRLMLSFYFDDKAEATLFKLTWG